MEPIDSKQSLRNQFLSLNRNKREALALLLVAILVTTSVLVVFVFSNTNTDNNTDVSEKKELPELTWKKFLEHYDTDGDGFVDEYAPDEFKEGSSILIKDVALDVEYDVDNAYSIITCNSTINSPLKDIHMIAYKNMESSKGDEFTYRMIFLRYSHYSSLTGNRIEILSKELAEIIDPDTALNFSPTKISPSTWSIEVMSVDGPINAEIMKYMITDANGTVVCTSGVPEMPGTEDVNGVSWNDVNGDGSLGDKDRILIHNEKIGSDYRFRFKIVYGAVGLASLP